MLALLLVACGGEEESAEEEAIDEAAPRLVGRVVSIHAEEGFVLIQGFGEWQLGEGLLLSSLGDDERTATLIASGERMGRFAAADLKAGRVEVGDAVYARPRIAPQEPPALPASAASAVEEAPQAGAAGDETPQ